MRGKNEVSGGEMPRFMGEKCMVGEGGGCYQECSVCHWGKNVKNLSQISFSVSNVSLQVNAIHHFSPGYQLR